jgi:hypothetical protein
MTIAFVPIDIDVQLPDEQQLIKFCQETKIEDIKDTNVNTIKFWDKVPVIGRLESDKDWYDIDKMRTALFNRYTPNLGACRYANNIDKVFPEIPYMLNQLPFKELSMVTMLVQREPVATHIDSQVYDIITDPTEIAIEMEPRRYNILMTKHHYKSFYVSESKDGEKIFPTITKETPCHAICESHHWHGAEYDGPDKIMLCVFGILDREKHLKMISQNLEKYKDRAIVF